MGVHSVSQLADHGSPSVSLTRPFLNNGIDQFTGEVRPIFSNEEPATILWKENRAWGEKYTGIYTR